jgi:hypothetical protein
MALLKPEELLKELAVTQDTTLKISRVDPKVPKINPEWKERAPKNNPCALNCAKRAMVLENLCCERDSEFRWYVPQRGEDLKTFLPLDERKISFVNSDIRDDASLLRVVTPPAAGIA